MFAVWFGMWIALALLNGWLNGQTRLLPAFGRGLIAAGLSGVAFYMVSGIWMPFDPAGWDYPIHFGYWNLAFLPGFAALLLGTGDNLGELREG